jgi:hypothetical protein
MIEVFLLLCTNGIQAQTVTPKLDQLKLMQTLVGNWQHVISNDSIEIVECQQYGNAFVENVYLVVNGKKSFEVIRNYGFSPKEGKFNVFQLSPSGNYSTWVASFTTEKKYYLNQVQNFDSDKVLLKGEIVFETPTNITATFFNLDGTTTGEFKWYKVK